MLGYLVDVTQDAVDRNRGVPLRRARIGLWKQHQPVNAEFRVALDRGLVQRPGWGNGELKPAKASRARKNPWDPQRQETIRSCLHVILKEEWEHLRYAVRDLDSIEAERTG